VNGYNFFDNPSFRCLFGTLVQTPALIVTPTAVWCSVPLYSSIPTTSRWANSIQILNDYTYPAGVSNSEPFTVVDGTTLPTIVGINPNTADRFCVATGTCQQVQVWGTALSPASKIECVWGSYLKPGRLNGNYRVGATVYDLVLCDQTAIYPLHMTQPVVVPFSLLIYRPQSGTILTSSIVTNQVNWTYTCNPCDV